MSGRIYRWEFQYNRWWIVSYGQYFGGTVRSFFHSRFDLLLFYALPLLTSHFFVVCLFAYTYSYMNLLYSKIFIGQYKHLNWERGWLLVRILSLSLSCSHITRLIDTQRHRNRFTDSTALLVIVTQTLLYLIWISSCKFLQPIPSGQICVPFYLKVN